MAMRLIPITETEAVVLILLLRCSRVHGVSAAGCASLIGTDAEHIVKKLCLGNEKMIAHITEATQQFQDKLKDQVNDMPPLPNAEA